MPDLNPYAPPATAVEAAAQDLTAAEQIRHQHAQQEACARGLGLVLFCIAATFAGTAVLAATYPRLAGSGRSGLTLWDAVGALAIGMVALRLGLGVRRLERGARLTLAPLAALILIFFPVGTGIAIWIYRRFLAKKSSVIFSTEYREIIRQAPGVSARLSWLDVVVLALALIFAAAGPLMYADERM